MGDSGDVAVAIEQLRADLEAAYLAGEDARFRFDLGEIELTLQLVATQEAGGKIGWSVFGVHGSIDSSHTHTVRLRLTPKMRIESGEWVDARVSDQTRTRRVGAGRPDSEGEKALPSEGE